MSSRLELETSRLSQEPKVWLITGVAGFIGSNLLEALLKLEQVVVGIDNFSTGHCHNLEEVRELVGEDAWRRFRFIDGDIADLSSCQAACQGIDVVLHQAALSSVSNSIRDPIATNRVNIDGFLNMLLAARDANVRRFVYASSSSTYGDCTELPNQEERIGAALSPYAVTKHANELYAKVFSHTYGIQTIGLRYFNVFGPRQDPNAAYAAVIPRWIRNLLNGEPCQIYGDGETGRDFCYVRNAVQANLLAALVEEPEALNQVYNIANGVRTTLNQLYSMLQALLAVDHPEVLSLDAEYTAFRQGDVRQSQAEIRKVQRLLGYCPTHSVEQGLKEALGWYLGKRTGKN